MDYEKIPAADLSLAADTPASDAMQETASDAMLTATSAPNIVTLPAGVSLDDIKVSGRDLIIEMPDGTTMVIPDGAIFTPQFVIDGIAVPPVNLAALLIGNEPEPAAGAVQSSGGNFADPVGPIQDAFAIGDLLPPTELAFPIYEEREIIPNRVSRDPTVVIVTPDNPVGAVNASDSVDEAGLPARGEEPAGSNAAASTETTTGSIVYTTPDGFGSVTINGVAVTSVGQTFTGAHGTLTITAIANGSISYSYTLADNTAGNNSSEDFTIVVTDVDGDTATGTLDIAIVDDVPDAVNDADSVVSGTYGPATGNVITDAEADGGKDTPGADGIVVSAVTGTAAGTIGGTTQGQYGVLTLNADGSYSYVRNAGTPGGVSDSFTYTITDGDGDTDTATLVISIGDSTTSLNLPTDGEAGTSVDEAGLPDGSAGATDAETTAGTFTYTAPDGPATVTIGGVAVTAVGQTFTGAHGTLTVTAIANGSISYSYTLTENTMGDATSDDFAVVVTDRDGDSSNGTLSVAIIDDVPMAVDDTDTINKGTYGPATGNVITDTEADGGKDTPGADGIVVSAVTGTVAGTIGGSTQGQYGVLTLNADGSYSYVRSPGTPGGVADSFTYTITDGDGDTDTATLVITISDSPATVISVPTTGGGTVVDEAGLPERGEEPEGSDEPSDVETTDGTITFTAPDGPPVVTINGVVITGPGQTITTPTGVLTITGYDPVAGTIDYSFTLTDNTAGDTTTETFTVVVTDVDGDSDSAEVTITIVNDVPTAVDDSAAQDTENQPVTVSVLSNDVEGADGVAPSTVAIVPDTLSGTGVLVVNPDGSITYTPGPGETGTVTFDYTITDGDGDSDTATVTISLLEDSTPGIALAGDTNVEEAGLPARGDEPAGSAATTNGEIAEGTITATTSNDMIKTLVIDGVDVTNGGSVTGTHGTLVVTRDGSTYSYVYTLTDNSNGDATSDDFTVVLTDSDDDSATEILSIAIVDDVPTANPDVDSVTEDDPLVADGNVIVGGEGSDTNATDGVIDIQGADGAMVVEVAFGATAGTVGGNTAGEYGTLILGADGHYSYTLDNADPRVQGLDSTESLTEIFTYTIKDADGDESETTLTITIKGANDPITITGLEGNGPDLIVDEDDLSDGSSPDFLALTQSDSFTVKGLDGINSITIEGTEAFVGQTFTTAHGTFTITSLSAPADGTSTSIVVGYQYVLSNDMDHATAAGENSFIESFDVVATDGDSPPAQATIEVEIVDDVPAANPDTNTVAEGGTLLVHEASGVLDSNDVEGADGATVVGVRTGNDTSTAATTDIGTEITGNYGKLTLNADGSYTYISNSNGVPAGVVIDYFVYSIRDADGDISTTTLQISVTDSALAATDDNNIVDEAALPIGSNPDSNAETTVGGDVSNNVTGGTGPYTFTLVDSGVGTHGTLTLNANGTYSYTLTTPVDGPTADNSTNIFDDVESFTYLVTDANGNTFEAEITIDVIDDVPTARDETPIIMAEDAAPVGGNVMTGPIPGSGDTQGADGATLTKVTIAGVDVTILAAGTTTHTNANGTYTFTAAGAWTFDPVAGSNNSEAIDVSFTYEITDGDGDKDSAVQPISVTDGANPTVSDPITLSLDDQNLVDGSTPGNPDFDSGTLTFTPGSDAIASIVFSTDMSTLGGGLTWVRVSDTQIVGSDGATPIVQLDLTVNGNNATVQATLLNTYDNHTVINVDDLAQLGTVAVIATDTDGDPVEGTVKVEVSDDLPTITAIDAPVGSIVVDETNLNANDSANFAGLFTPDVNADGPGTIAYSLVVAAGAASGLIDVATGERVMLSINGAGEVEGKTETGGLLVFTISVDALGEVTLDQDRAVRHPVATNPDDALGFTGADLIGLEARITDADGDWAEEVADLTGAFTFHDDGPSIIANATDSAALVLTTQDAETIGAPDTAQSTANFSGAFSVTTSNYGADGAGTTNWAYSLEILNSASGLFSHGVAITLSMNGATVEGRAGGTLIFSVGVDATGGTVTLTQYGPIDHALETVTGPIFDDQLATLGNGIIRLVGEVTIKDRDNDTDSDRVTLDLGGNIKFADHGPDVSLRPGAEASLLVDDSDFATNASANLSGLFNPVNYGADGAGSVKYALAITNANSGLVDTLTNEAVMLSVTGAGVIEGRAGTGGPLVFTVTVDALGNVTLDQSRAVVHTDDTTPNEVISIADGIITLEQIATDYDGDTDSAVANIGGMLQFADDAPTVGTNAAVQLDDETLPHGNPGGTGDVDPNTANLVGTLAHDFNNDGGNIAFLTSGAPAGFTYVLSGTSLLIKQGTTTVVTVTLDPITGAYGVTQNAPIAHPLGLNENDVSFTLSYRVTDGDHDWIDGNIIINVDDDTPIANDDTATTVAEDAANIGGNVLTNDNPGADGASLTSVTIGGVTTDVAAAGTTTVTTTLGVYTFTATGVWTFNPNTNLNNAAPLDASFSYVITDGDGDKDDAVQAISVTDGALPTTTKNAAIIVDEQGLGTANATGSNAVDNTETKGDTVTFSGGSDQIASVVFGSIAGISVTGYNGTAITWALTGGTTITGTINGIVAITLTLTGITTGASAGATVTATLSDNFQHLSGSGENSISISGVTVVATDTDGDPTSASVGITIIDDVPTVTVTANTGITCALDETATGSTASTLGVANIGDDPHVAGSGWISRAVSTAAIVTVGGVYGADGAAAINPLTYALSVTNATSGLFTTEGTAIILVKEGDIIVGRVGTSGGVAAFAVSINSATGIVTVEQYLSLRHPVTTNHDDTVFLGAGTLGVVVTRTDGDNDQAVSAPATDISGQISFDDDGPTAVAPASISLVNSIGTSKTALLDADSNIANNMGSDGGVVRFAASLGGTNSGLTSNLNPITYSVSADGLTLTGIAGGATVFTITLNQANSTYTVNMVGTVDSITTVDFNAGGYKFVGGNGAWAGFVPTGEPTSGTDNNSRDILMTPEDGGVNASTINASSVAGGIGDGNSVGTGEVFRVDFVTDLRGDPGGSGGYGVSGNRDHVFDAHYTTNGSSAVFTATNGSVVKISAYDDTNGNNVVGDGTLDTITRVSISWNGASVVITPTTTQPVSVGGRSYTVTFNGDGTVNVGGVYGTSGNNADGTQIAIFTNNGYNSVEYAYVSGDEFKLGDFGAAVPSTNPVNFVVPVVVVDGDGDSSGSSNLAIQLTAPQNGAKVAAASKMTAANDTGTSGVAAAVAASGLAAMDMALQPVDIRTAEPSHDASDLTAQPLVASDQSSISANAKDAGSSLAALEAEHGLAAEDPSTSSTSHFNAEMERSPVDDVADIVVSPKQSDAISAPDITLFASNDIGPVDGSAMMEMLLQLQQSGSSAGGNAPVDPKAIAAVVADAFETHSNQSIDAVIDHLAGPDGAASLLSEAGVPDAVLNQFFETWVGGDHGALAHVSLPLTPEETELAVATA